MNNRQNVPPYDNPYEGYHDESYQPSYDMHGYEYNIDPTTGEPYPYDQVQANDNSLMYIHLCFFFYV